MILLCSVYHQNRALDSFLPDIKRDISVDKAFKVIQVSEG